MGKEHVMENKDLNMPQDIKTLLFEILADERWSWFGMAKIFTDTFGESDIEEFVLQLNMMKNGEGTQIKCLNDS